jgi:hypothetical protein
MHRHIATYTGPLAVRAAGREVVLSGGEEPRRVAEWIADALDAAGVLPDDDGSSGRETEPVTLTLVIEPSGAVDRVEGVRPPEFTFEQASQLFSNHGGPLGRIEVIEGWPVTGGKFRMVFTREQARAAASFGVELPDLVDEVLADAELRAEVIARLAAKHQS